jgi:hypothetical protein
MKGGLDRMRNRAMTLEERNFILLGLFSAPKCDPSKKREGGDLELPRRLTLPRVTMSMLLTTMATMSPLLRATTKTMMRMPRTVTLQMMLTSTPLAMMVSRSPLPRASVSMIFSVPLRRECALRVSA